MPGDVIKSERVGMGFSAKIAPGVRVRASSRGVRTSIGPRAARVHVGAGRTGFSTGVGPVGFYAAAGKTRRRTTTSRGRSPSVAQLQRQAAAAQKAQEAQRLAAVIRDILNVHRQEFPPVQRPIAPPPVPPDEKKIRAQHEHAAVNGEQAGDGEHERRQARQAAPAAGDVVGGWVLGGGEAAFGAGAPAVGPAVRF